MLRVDFILSARMTGLFRWRKVLVILFLFMVQMRIADCEISLQWKNKIVVLAAPIFPQYKDFGIQTSQEKNVSGLQRLHLFEQNDMNELCWCVRNASLLNHLREQYEGTIVIIGPEVNVGCPHSSSKHSFSHLDTLCSLHAVIVSSDLLSATLTNTRPIDKFRGLQYHRNCTLLITPMVYDPFALNLIERNETFGTVSFDNNEFDLLFQSLEFQILYKYLCGLGYLFVSAYGFFVFMCRLTNQTLNSVFCAIFSVNIASGAFLGVVQLQGSHFTDNELPYAVVSFGFLTFFGSSAGTNALILLIYEQLISSISVKTSGLEQIARTWKYWALAFFLICMDFFLAALVVMNSLSATTVAVVLIVEVGAFYAAQAFVLYRTIKLSSRVNKALCRKSLKGIVPVLRVHFRYWMAVSVVASVLNVVAYTFGVIFRHVLRDPPSIWKFSLFIFGLTLGKLVHLLAQFKLCSPLKAATVAPATVSSVGYVSFLKG